MIWKLLTGAGMLAFAGFLVLLYGHSKVNEGRLDERSAWLKIVAQRDAEIAKLNLGNANARADAAEAYADKLAGLQPVIVRSTNTVERFATTDAGRVACLSSDRVFGIEKSAAELGFPIAARTGSPDTPLPAITPADGP